MGGTFTGNGFDYAHNYPEPEPKPQQRRESTVRVLLRFYRDLFRRGR